MAVDAVRKLDRILVAGAIVVLAGISWAYIIHLGLGMPSSSTGGSMIMPMMRAWSATDFTFMLVMWAVMMFAMMLPSVTPTVVIYERVRARREESGRPFVPTAAFVAGYLLAWVGFSLAATVLNWWLHSEGMLSSMIGRVAPATGGAILIVAGLYQWTPAKDACLDHCRSPISFLMTQWREGPTGALAMGLHHGAFCLGCCWMLMALLFVLGVMNLAWVAVLTIVVLAEKALPAGRHLSRGLGAGLVAWGSWLVLVS